MSRPFTLAIVLALAFSAVASEPAEAASAAGRIEFEVLREGQPFGSRGVTVTLRDGVLQAETTANLQVQFGPITLFSYTQRCSATWRNGALVTLRCLTLQNGRDENVEGGLNAGALRVAGATGKKRWARLDSNQEPDRYERPALTIELRAPDS